MAQNRSPNMKSLRRASVVVFVSFEVFLFGTYHRNLPASSSLKEQEHDHTVSGRSICKENPYLRSLELNHTSIRSYNDGFSLARENALKDPITHHNHERFRIFRELAPCRNLTCVGGECGDDASKIACGIDKLQEESCVIYSIGGNNKWQFEEDLLQRTKCQIHTFDCTGPESRFQVPEHDRLHFHYECIHGGNGTKPNPMSFTLEELTTRHNHSQIDLFKMDIEGFEYGVFESFQEASRRHYVLPMQILVEVHYRTQFKQLFPSRTTDFKSEVDLIDTAKSFLDLGYVVVKRDDNTHCRHCTELTLMRVYC